MELVDHFWLIYGYYMIMVNIWLIYGYYMVIVWLMMVNNNLVGGVSTPLKKKKQISVGVTIPNILSNTISGTN